MSQIKVFLSLSHLVVYFVPTVRANNWVWSISGIAILRRLRQEADESEASLGYPAGGPCLVKERT